MLAFGDSVPDDTCCFPMSLFRPSKRKKPRTFGYEPRFYDPDKDEDIKRRMRVKRRRKRRRSPMSLLYFLGLLLFALYIYQAL